MSYLVKSGLISRMDQYAAPLRKLSLLFFNFGSQSGGMSIRMQGVPKKEAGVAKSGEEVSLEWQVGVHEGDGPQVPSICAIVVAKKLAAYNASQIRKEEPLYEFGARPCIGFFTLDELKTEMKRLKAFFYVERMRGEEYLKKEFLYEKSVGDEYFAQLPHSLKKFHSAPEGGYGMRKYFYIYK